MGVNKHLYLSKSNIQDIEYLQRELKFSFDVNLSQSKIIDCCISEIMNRPQEDLFKILASYNCL